VMHATNSGGSPNRLLAGLSAASLGIHLLLCAHLANRYQGESTSYLELSMRDISEPAARSIPRPRVRTKAPELQGDQSINIRERRVPQIKVEPLQTRPESISVGSVSIPALPDMSGVRGLKVGDWTPVVGGQEFMTRQDYTEMVRIKIESRKRYPESARSRRTEGRVTVRFTITPEGRVTGIQMVKSSGHALLDQAALNTVKEASPFPRAPSNLFKGSFQMEIVLAFELM